MLLKQWNLKNEVNKEEEGEISGEGSMDAYILTYVNSQWGFAV